MLSFKKLSCSSYVDVSPTASLTHLFLSHGIVDGVPPGFWDSCFFTPVVFVNTLFFLSVGWCCPPTRPSCLGAPSRVPRPYLREQVHAKHRHFS